MDMKICSKCKRELPATSEYFYTDKRWNCFCSRCKECYGASFKPQIREHLTLFSEKEGYKICTKCSKELPATKEFFCVQRKGLYGLSQSCKKCDKQYRDDNEEQLLVQKKEYRESHKKEQHELWKQWYHSDVEASRERNRKYYNDNRETICEKRKTPERKETLSKWRKNNPEKEAATKHKYRSKVRQLEQTLTQKEWNKCKKYFEGKCCYCGDEVDRPDMEHFIPVSKNGDFSVGNIVPSCGRCNSSKGNRKFETWYSKQPFYSQERELKILKYIIFNGQGKES